MATYETLKAAIDQYIKANGNKEITGTILNNVLTAMINELGNYATFAGVATPSTNPGQPEQSVVYFASQAGVYTNFGAVSLPLGIHLLIWDGSYWDVKTFFMVDTEPTFGRYNLVTSGGVYHAIEEEQMRAMTKETKSATLNTTTNRIEFKNEIGQVLYSIPAYYTEQGIVKDVELVGSNLLITFETTDGDKVITIPLEDIFNVNNYYTKGEVDAFITSIQHSITVLSGKLESGGLYMGFAFPYSSPSDIGTRQFYVATEKGTYSHFLANGDIPLVISDNGIYFITVGEDVDDCNLQEIYSFDKHYLSEPFGGMGRIYLTKNIQTVGGVQKNLLTQAMMSESNTIYHIQYDFELAEDITVPAGCVLEFDGGSINGAYTLTGSSTLIKADRIVILGDDITISGTWNIPVVYSEWIENATSSNNLRKAVALLSSGNKLIVGTGTHILSLTEGDDHGIELPNNTELQIDGEIKANTNNLGGYYIVLPSDNCYIHGGKITGDKDTSSSTGEQGHGIATYGYNITIENVEISNCLGDGIYIPVSKTTIMGCKIHDCRRQGISVGDGIGVRILYNEIYNISGTNPQSCIDVEPPRTTSIVKDIYIIGNNLHDSVQGVIVAGSESLVENVVVEANHINGIINFNINIKHSKNVIVTNNTITTAGNLFYNIENSQNVIISSNEYTSTKNASQTNNGLYIDADCIDVKILNNILNYTYGMNCVLYNCLFEGNTIINSGIAPKDKVVVKNNYINGGFNCTELDTNNKAIVSNNEFYIKAESITAFFYCNHGVGSLIFTDNKVTIDATSLNRFYFHNDSSTLALFVEKNNIYDAPNSLSTPPAFTKGVREWNYSVKDDGYTSFYNTKLYTPAQ